MAIDDDRFRAPDIAAFRAKRLAELSADPESKADLTPTFSSGNALNGKVTPVASGPSRAVSPPPATRDKATGKAILNLNTAAEDDDNVNASRKAVKGGVQKLDPEAIKAADAEVNATYKEKGMKGAEEHFVGQAQQGLKAARTVRSSEEIDAQHSAPAAAPVAASKPAAKKATTAGPVTSRNASAAQGAAAPVAPSAPRNIPAQSASVAATGRFQDMLKGDARGTLGSASIGSPYGTTKAGKAAAAPADRRSVTSGPIAGKMRDKYDAHVAGGGSAEDYHAPKVAKLTEKYGSGGTPTTPKPAASAPAAPSKPAVANPAPMAPTPGSPAPTAPASKPAPAAKTVASSPSPAMSGPKVPANKPAQSTPATSSKATAKTVPMGKAPGNSVATTGRSSGRGYDSFPSGPTGSGAIEPTSVVSPGSGATGHRSSSYGASGSMPSDASGHLAGGQFGSQSGQGNMQNIGSGNMNVGSGTQNVTTHNHYYGGAPSGGGGGGGRAPQMPQGGGGAPTGRGGILGTLAYAGLNTEVNGRSANDGIHEMTGRHAEVYDKTGARLGDSRTDAKKYGQSMHQQGRAVAGAHYGTAVNSSGLGTRSVNESPTGGGGIHTVTPVVRRRNRASHP
jgi:hypothetical protein